MLSHAVGLSQASWRHPADRRHLCFDLDADLAESILIESELEPTERLLLLGASRGLENALAGTVAAGRMHATQLPPDPALGSFDLCILRLSTSNGAAAFADIGGAAETLRPGGKLVLLAHDPGSLELWPRVEGFAGLWDALQSYASTAPNTPAILDELAQAAGLRSLGHKQLACCSGEDRGSFLSTAGNLIATLCTAREAILARTKISPAEFSLRIRALQQWRALPNASLSHSASYAAGRRRMKEYLTLLPGAELAYSAI